MAFRKGWKEFGVFLRRFGSPALVVFKATLEGVVYVYMLAIENVSNTYRNRRTVVDRRRAEAAQPSVSEVES